MQRINQWIPSCLVGLVGLLECSQSAIAASPLLARLQAISQVGRGCGCSLTLVQKLQRIVHFREGTIRNTGTIDWVDEWQRAAFASHKSASQFWRPAHYGITWWCVCHGEPTDEQRPAFLNPYTSTDGCIYLVRKGHGRVRNFSIA